MKNLARIIAGLVGTFIALNGLLFMFNPDMAAELAQLGVDNNFAYGTLRSIIGGSMLAAAFFAIMAAVKVKKDFLHFVAIVCLFWTIGRVVSLMVDGFDINVLGNTILSLVLFALAMVSYRLFDKSEATS